MSTQTVFLTAAATSKTFDVSLVQKAAATSPGDPLTGLAFNTSSFTAYYRKGATGTATAITLATQTVGGAWSSGGFVEVSSSNAPGLYRFDIPDTVIATAGFCTVTFNGAANLATHTVIIVVTAVDFYDAVRMGLTALPNVVSGSAGAIVTSGTGTAQLATTSGNVALTSTGNTAVVTELMGTTTENNGSITFKSLMRTMSSVLLGRVSISGSTVTFKTADNVKTRVTTVTDSSNQRTTVTLDGTD